jgi:hypothetical protein
VLNQVRLWAVQVAAEHPGLERVALFGSYGRGDAGVGSDLDLLLIDSGSNGPQHQRLLVWPLAELPLSCDALVLTVRRQSGCGVAPNRLTALEGFI